MDVSKGALITRDPLSSEQSSRQCRPPGSQSDVSRRRTQPRDSRVHHTWLPHTQRLPLARLPLHSVRRSPLCLTPGMVIPPASQTPYTPRCFSRELHNLARTPQDLRPFLAFPCTAAAGSLLTSA